jgi:hypothetical protein
VDGADAQGGAGGGELGGDVNLPVVDIQPLGETAAQDRHLQDPLQTRQRFLEEELAVGDEPRVVVDEAEQRGAAKLTGAVGIGQVRPDEHVALPERVGVLTLEAAEGLRLIAQVRTALAPAIEDIAQGARGDGQGGRIGGIAAQDLDEQRGAAAGDLLAQGDGPGDQLLGDAPNCAGVRPRPGLEGLEAAPPVARQVPPDRFLVQMGAGREGDLVRLGSDGAQVRHDLPTLQRAVQERGDEPVAEEGDLGPPLLLGGQRRMAGRLHGSPPGWFGRSSGSATGRRRC